MSNSKLWGRIGAGAALAPAGAMAATLNASDPFFQFLQTVQNYARGALGISLCIIAVLFGAIVGIGRNNPVAALGGVAFALFIYFAPSTIIAIFNAGAVLT